MGGTVSAGGAALAVMDIGAAQDLFGRQGQLSRIDVRLRPGVDQRGVPALAAACRPASSRPSRATRRSA